MPKRLAKGISAKKVIVAMVLTLAVGAAALWASLAFRLPEGVELAGFPEGSTDPIAYAGRFPAVDDAPLENPLGMDLFDDRIYVAESGAGRIAVFTLQGGRYDDIVVPPADGRTDVYPLDVAVIDGDRIAVIDSASARVLILDVDGSGVRAVVGEGSTMPGQPTALTVAGDELYVADGESGLVMVFSAEDGTFKRSLGAELAPPLTYPGGLFLAEDGLYIADSNAGRIIVIDSETGELIRIMPDRYSLPRGLVAGMDGGEFVVDTFAATAIALDKDGIRLFGTDDVTDPNAALASPRDVCVAAGTGRMYISDADAGEIVVYNVRMSGPATE